MTKKKCPACKGTGEYRHKGNPPLKCTECGGDGAAKHFLMIFWAYDQFPFVLADRGFMRDDGLAFVPSYNACFQPTRTMPLKEGRWLWQQIEALRKERQTVLDTLEKGYRIRLDHIAHHVLKKP